MPNKTDRARLNQKFRTGEKAAFVARIQQKLRQSKRSIRSGYAFSQQEGWGPLITSGRMRSKSVTSHTRPAPANNTVSQISIQFFSSSLRDFPPFSLVHLLCSLQISLVSS
jgi:hypothetical protein